MQMKMEQDPGFYGRVAGEKLTMIDEVCSEVPTATSTGNKALSMLLASDLCADPARSVDIYTKQCSSASTPHNLRGWVLTLANNGIARTENR